MRNAPIAVGFDQNLSRVSYFFPIKQTYRKIIEIGSQFQRIIPKPESTVLAGVGLGYNCELFRGLSSENGFKTSFDLVVRVILRVSNAYL